MAAVLEKINIESFEKVKNKLETLLQRRANIALEEIPNELEISFSTFIVGKTMLVKEGKAFINFGDFVEYYNMLWKIA